MIYFNCNRRSCQGRSESSPTDQSCGEPGHNIKRKKECVAARECGFGCDFVSVERGRHASGGQRLASGDERKLPRLPPLWSGSVGWTAETVASKRVVLHEQHSLDPDVPTVIHLLRSLVGPSPGDLAPFWIARGPAGLIRESHAAGESVASCAETSRLSPGHGRHVDPRLGHESGVWQKGRPARRDVAGDRSESSRRADLQTARLRISHPFGACRQNLSHDSPKEKRMIDAFCKHLEH